MNSGGGLVEVVVKVDRASAEAQSPANLSFHACAARLGVKFEAIHLPGSGPESGTYFTAKVDPAALDHVIEELLHCDGVEGAYAKRRDEAP